GDGLGDITVGLILKSAKHHILGDLGTDDNEDRGVFEQLAVTQLLQDLLSVLVAVTHVVVAEHDVILVADTGSNGFLAGFGGIDVLDPMLRSIWRMEKMKLSKSSTIRKRFFL